jgi:Protein of unknown function (DUF2586).
MNGITITRQNGGVPKALSGKDYISGFLTYMADTALPEGFSATKREKIVSTIEACEALGITKDATLWRTRALHYNLSEFFRQSPGATLYIGIYAEKGAEETYDFSEIKTLQTYSGGQIRQVGLYCPFKSVAVADITALQAVATLLQNSDMPLSIIYSGKIDTSSLGTLPALRATGNKNVSVCIAQDESSGSRAKTLQEEAANTLEESVGALGALVGAVAKSNVNESIGWVEKYPVGYDTPGVCGGKELREIEAAVQESLDGKGYIFARTYNGFTGSYWSDSKSLDLATSDYGTIESVRVMDKAARGVREYLLPQLGRPMYIDPESGQIAAQDVVSLENIAGKALEQMEKEGQISGYSVYIDPKQDVLGSAKIEVVMKIVAVGVARQVAISIGYTTQTE